MIPQEGLIKPLKGKNLPGSAHLDVGSLLNVVTLESVPAAFRRLQASDN